MTLYETLTDKEFIFKCWDEIYKSKSPEIRKFSRGCDNISIEDFKKQENKLIQQMYIDLKNHVYKMNKLKGIFIQKSKKNTYRLLSVPTIQDRILHRAILKIITPIVYPYINTEVSYCGVSIKLQNKSQTDSHSLNLRNAIIQLSQEVKKGNYWVFESDIKGFFDYVPKKQLLNKIYNILPDKSLNKLIKQVVYFNIDSLDEIKKDKKSKTKGLSQGSSLSPLFSNIYLADFDRKMKFLCGKGIIRYVDDFIIIENDKNLVKNHGSIAEKLLNSEGLELSPMGEKTHIKNLKNDFIVFLGLKISKNHIRPKQTDKEILCKFNQQKLNFKQYKKIKRGKTTITKIEQINDSIFGWIHCYKYYHVKNLYQKIIQQIEEKKANKQYTSLKSIKSVKLKPIISLEK